MIFEIAKATLYINSTTEPSELASIALLAMGLIAGFWFLKNASDIFHFLMAPFVKAHHRKSKQDWHPILTSRYYVQRKIGFEIWSINFAGSQNLSFESIFSKNQFGFFDLGRTAQETDGMLAPILRKVILKYRPTFERVRPIQTIRGQAPEHMMTWLHNPSQFRIAIFRFLDECQTISANMKCDPCLDIVWDQEFSLTVLWKDPDSRFNEMFRALVEPSPELIVIQNDGVLGLSLCLSFNEKQLSKHITRLSKILRRQYTNLPDVG